MRKCQSSIPRMREIANVREYKNPELRKCENATMPKFNDTDCENAKMAKCHIARLRKYENSIIRKNKIDNPKMPKKQLRNAKAKKSNVRECYV